MRNGLFVKKIPNYLQLSYIHLKINLLHKQKSKAVLFDGKSTAFRWLKYRFSTRKAVLC